MGLMGRHLVLMGLFVAWVMWVGNDGDGLNRHWQFFGDFKEGESQLFSPQESCEKILVMLEAGKPELKGRLLCMPDGVDPNKGEPKPRGLL
jgi:hypothetical protein